MSNLNLKKMLLLLLVTLLLTSLGIMSQQAADAQAVAAISGSVPRLINYNGVLKDASGKILTSVTGVTFLLYKDDQGGAPLWLETQNVTPDRTGHYTVQLGAAAADGLPPDLFATGEARWLAVQISGEQEQARVLLVAVPYAMKAADAETLGGLPASAFVLAAPPNAVPAAASANPASATAPAVTPLASSDVTTTGGTTDTIPMYTTATNVQNSILTQTGTTAINVGGKLNLPATGVATTAAGKNSQPHDFVASSYNSSTKAAVGQTFQLQAEPAGNDTATPSGTLNLLYGSGTATPAETGLKISSKGLLTFAAGQAFPGTGKGTITGVTAGSDLTGGGTSGSVTLNLDTTKVPLLASANTFTAGQAINSSGITAGLKINAGGGGDGIDATSLSIGVSGVSTSATGVQGTSTSGTGVSGSTSGSSGYGVSGINYATGGTGVYGSGLTGVEGTSTSGTGVSGSTSDSSGYGVSGINYATGGTGVGIGVYGIGWTDLSEGVWGQIEGESDTGTFLSGFWGSGVWGDGGTSGEGFGVAGTVDDFVAGEFMNNSPFGYAALVAEAENSASTMLDAYNSATGGDCYVDASGNLNCTGSKNAVVPLDSGARIVALSAIESPKNWFEDFGSAQLVNGAALVTLDAEFTQTVNTGEEYQVFLTPYGDCKGLYVSNRTANSFEVHELGGGSASLSFGYRITALRRNYENVRFADHTHDLDSLKRMRERARMNHAQPQSHDPKRKMLLTPASQHAEVRPVAAR